MLGSQPIEEHAVGELARWAAHLGTERRRNETGPKLGSPRGDPRAYAFGLLPSQKRRALSLAAEGKSSAGDGDASTYDGDA